MWKRTHDASQAATSEHDPSGQTPPALIHRDSALLQPWALGADGGRRLRRCLWWWLRCLWAPRATCIPERVSRVSGLGGKQRGGEGTPYQNGAAVGDSEPSSVEGGWTGLLLGLCRGRKPLTLAFAHLGSRF